MANETKWTPGPWTVHQDDDGQPIAGIRERAGDRFIALTQFDAEDCRTVEAANARRAECAANARLIAAAPEMAEALRDMLAQIASDVDASNGFHDGAQGTAARLAAEAALAAAEGRDHA